MSDAQRHRPIRSYVLREGRLTRGQQRAFEQLWPRVGIDFADAPLDLPTCFGNDHPVTLEIGFGNGESLAQMAQALPGRNFLGIEVHRPGVGHLLIAIEQRALENVRVIRHDAVEVLQRMIPDAAIDRLQLFFPDPWHKKRHHKRRLLNPAFVREAARVIRPGGTFHAATDWEHYADQMLEVLQAQPAFVNASGTGNFAERPDHRPLTKFEQRGQRLGHGVWDLLFTRR